MLNPLHSTPTATAAPYRVPDRVPAPPPTPQVNPPATWTPAPWKESVGKVMYYAGITALLASIPAHRFGGYFITDLPLEQKMNCVYGLEATLALGIVALFGGAYLRTQALPPSEVFNP